MPLHTLGVKIPNSFYGITFSDVMSLLTCYLFYAQPGLDPKVVMQWIIDNVFFGSLAWCSVLGIYVSHKLVEWGGMGWYTVLYRLESKVSGARPLLLRV
jgi:hypothetical protein